MNVLNEGKINCQFNIVTDRKWQHSDFSGIATYLVQCNYANEIKGVILSTLYLTLCFHLRQQDVHGHTSNCILP